jgi:F-type H+-transporting ATPase subunit gamma
MQLVAASKMRRSQEATKASAPYTFAARDLLTAVSRHTTVENHPLYKRRDIKTRLLVVIASDKGLAGAYNSNIIKLFLNELQKDVNAEVKNQTIAIGRKAAQFAARLNEANMVAYYEDLPDRPTAETLYAILDTAIEKFQSGEVDAVDLIFTEFISSVRQDAKTVRLLPVGFEPTEDDKTQTDALYEPDASEVIGYLTYRLLGAQVFQVMLEARASEYIMRMLAMKNATDNATDLINDLTLAMNKARQGAITQELAEISGGVEALNE